MAEWRDPVTPAHEQRAISQSTAEAGHQHQAAGLDATIMYGFDETHRNGGRAHVAVFVHGHHHPFHRDAGVFRHRFDDAQVGLMWDHQVHLVGCESGLRQHTRARFTHSLHGALEDHLAIEVPERIAECHVPIGVATTDAAHAQARARLDVATEHAGEHAFFFVGGLYHDGCRAVTKQHRDVSVAPVHVTADQLDADHDGVPHDTGADHRCGR